MTDATDDAFQLSFKVFHELMAKKVSEILMVSSPYDAFIVEEEGRLAERIIQEYRGLNLSRPPRLTWVSTAEAAYSLLAQKRFDCVMTTPRIGDMTFQDFGEEIKARNPDLPVFLLTHNMAYIAFTHQRSIQKAIDKTLVWRGNADLLMAMVKNLEDSWNIARDTKLARVRVIILVEDSPYYFSSLLPLLYKEIVLQTQAVMEDAVNEEHRLLRMRARPKIVVAENFEAAQSLYRRYRPYLLSVISDVRFPRGGQIDPEAGFALLQEINTNGDSVPLLMVSSEEHNRTRAEALDATFIDKNSPALHSKIRSFFVQHLGFGDFVFRMPDGREVGRATNLRSLEKTVAAMPDESILYHATNNDFSTWLMARSEVMLATRLRPVKTSDFSSVAAIKNYLVSCIHARRRGQQKGIVTDFDPDHFDPDIDFCKMGRGSLGGKARGLAFISTLLKDAGDFKTQFASVDIVVPKTLVVSTEGFDSFISQNQLTSFIATEADDQKITRVFGEAQLADWLRENIRIYLQGITFPLAVRSSSLLEDAYFQPFAGIYNTFMLPNDAPSHADRVAQLEQAIKLVWASTFFKAPRSYSSSTLHRVEEEKMAVIVQQLMGRQVDGVFYPAMSGVAQSYNFYPVAHMKPEEGIAHMALGLGKTVVEGGNALRFSPLYPQLLPQFSTTDDIMQNAQRRFYALKMGSVLTADTTRDDITLVKLDIDEAADHPAVRHLASSYNYQDNRIRDSWQPGAHPVLTFASILKHRQYPLPEVISGLLEIGRTGMGGPVEIEFSVNLPAASSAPAEFAVLQIRPMTVGNLSGEVDISENDLESALIVSRNALGQSQNTEICHIIYVKPENFDPGNTVQIAGEIGKLNASLSKEPCKYLLIGPGRWGSADRWLGIPVNWNDISAVGTIVETSTANLKADPSQGSHFFHNITSLGIGYLTVRTEDGDRIDWQWLAGLETVAETTYVRHVRLDQPVVLKIDGKTSQAVLLPVEL